MHPWQDSNLQPPDPWSGALPLSHTDMVSKQILSGRNRTSDPVIADIYSHMLYQLSYAE